MRKKFALLTAIAALALVAVPVGTAQAKTIKLTVTPTFDLVDACRPAAGQIRFKMEFGAKFKRKNSPYPKSVKYSYTVRDQNGVSFASGSVTLTKKGGWKKTTKDITAASGTTIYFSIKGTFRSPSTGKLLKMSDAFSFALATDEELIANGIPPCA